MPGYRSGFMAGDPELIAALKRYRPNVGTAPPEFVQRAAVTAWGDEEHVVETRARYAAKRDLVLPALRAAGLEPAGGDASFFLWLRIGPADPGGMRRRSRSGCWTSSASSSRRGPSSGGAARAMSGRRWFRPSRNAAGPHSS
jgi:aspartate/methionine/tyrosine aminotransferase